MAETDPVIFIASTCYDLADIRAELKADLEKDRFIVRLSEYWDSDFQVDPRSNSIQSCLKNLETSDTVLFIFDRRYGPPIPGDKNKRSATHIEYDHAREKGIPSLYFVRGRTWDQLFLWSEDREGYKPRYVEETRHVDLFELIAEVRTLNLKDPKNNWIEPFKDSVELRRIAQNMLYKLHPAYAGARAKTRDRVVRLTFTNVFTGGIREEKRASLKFKVLNAGLNLAVDIRVRVEETNRGIEGLSRHLEVLDPGEKTQDIDWKIPRGIEDCRLVCEYSNLWSDSFEVTAPLTQPTRIAAYSKGKEEFRVLEAR